ncbi:probable serine/threonine-protein kinase PBL7 [Hibiscus syriacus]|uniref:probable serine/threonine-protein kinase PBL7 n=1 Tax=Hibiscus syriacus TaxID=106335 RepID=UPI001923AF25|nr:probable serine/threonine-protein kinase PBL7 [Hibiscus syriacus]
MPAETPAIHPIGLGLPPSTHPDPVPSLTRTPPGFGRTRNGNLAASPSSKVFHHSSSSMYHSPTKAIHPHHALKPSRISVAPTAPSFGYHGKNRMHGPASLRSIWFYKHHHAKKHFRNLAPRPSYSIHQPAYRQQGLILSLGSPYYSKRREGLARSMIAVIILSSFSAFVVCLGIIWLIVWKYGACIKEPENIRKTTTVSPPKPSGSARAVTQGSKSSAASISISSSVMTCTGLAKNFTLNDIERATNSFDASRVIGEGGFGIVYRGSLDEGAAVAVKVLKRKDQHGGQEFLAEVEMLSRLHHRNLIKLIGICAEENICCLVYELVPNGSLESHLHGAEKETNPLDWGARMKIALGAARGLAYLHEDSSPRVIHRDFKSSNILLEHDFTPKVSDFGLARTAMDEGNKYISTHVMGTFGYLAPEYAMTGHLLVKSDVYSYGVVLLELLTGRKPVDLLQPPGEENLVAWARPLLTDKEGLETIIDPVIKSDISVDSITKVAAIASMCVQPEVSHRPFMGEVVQALKLVCNEFDEKMEVESKADIQEDFPTTVDSKLSRLPSELGETSETYHPIPGYDYSRESNIALCASDFLSIPPGLEVQEPGSFRRHSCSAPLRTGRRRHFLQRIRSLSRGSRSEHGFSVKFW